MKRLLTATAVIELGAGLALLGFPSAASRLLLGVPLEGPAGSVVARVGGAGLLALGTACWLARIDARSRAARGVVGAMLLYNLGAFVVLGVAGLRGHPVGVALWPAVGLHLAMTAWCVARLSREASGIEPEAGRK